VFAQHFLNGDDEKTSKKLSWKNAGVAGCDLLATAGSRSLSADKSSTFLSICCVKICKCPVVQGLRESGNIVELEVDVPLADHATVSAPAGSVEREDGWTRR
jgi:hypothetical protein